MKTKLILVEGIPGSGKSTTARFLAEHLQVQHIPTRLHLEGHPAHPVSPDGMAFFNPDQYHALLAEMSKYRSLVEANAQPLMGGYVIDFWSIDQPSRLPEELYEALSARDIYASFAPEALIPLLREKWQHFANAAVAQEGCTIFECCFLQDTFTVLLGQHNYHPEAVMAHIQNLAQIIEPLNPLLIYLDGGEVRAVLEHAATVRPQQWIDSVTDYITRQGYGKAHALQGMQGVIHFYENMKTLMETILSRMTIPVLRVDVSHQDWQAAHQQITDHLKEILRYR